MTVVITGASRGIGAGLALAYRARDEDVIGTTRGAEWPMDVTDPASVDLDAHLTLCGVRLWGLSPKHHIATTVSVHQNGQHVPGRIGTAVRVF